MHAAGQLFERHAARPAGGPEPADYELATDPVVSDLLRGELFGVEENGQRVIARIAKRVRATLDGNGSKYLEHGLPA